jgi:glycosyltransferase involved in cell wall biosynthesis
VDEIVVVDSGSTDNTVPICQEYTDRVICTDWPGFGPQKNRALDAASGDWILSIDADERVSAPLGDELRAITRDSAAESTWLIPRRSSYCGRMMRHSGWHPDYVLRFFRRGCGRFSDDLVHERLIAESTPGRTTSNLLHFPMESLEDAIAKMNRYSTLAARAKHLKGERGSMLKAVSRGTWTFVRTYLLLLGFLDGRQGFLLAVTNAGGTYLKYAKLVLMQSGEKS